MPSQRSSRAVRWTASVLLAVAVAPTPAAPSTAPPEVLGYVMVPDAQALLERIEATAAAHASTAPPPGSLGMLLGTGLGDPDLKGLGRGPIVALLLAPDTPLGKPGAVLMMPAKDPAPYLAALSGRGWAVENLGADGEGDALLAAGLTPDALADRAALLQEYRRAASRPATGLLCVSLRSRRLMETYGTLLHMGLDAGLERMSAPPPRPTAESEARPNPQPTPIPTGAARMLRMQTKALMVVLEQADEVRTDFDLRPKQAPQAWMVETVLTARAATALDDVTRHPAAGPNGAATILASLPDAAAPALGTATYQLDAPRLAAFAASLGRSVSDVRTAPLLNPLLALVEQLGRAYTGEAAVRMTHRPPSTFVTEMVARVTDEGAALRALESNAALMAPNSAWRALYEDRGLPMTATLQRAVRRHAGIAVHRQQASIEKSATAKDAALMSALMRDTEFAFVGSYQLSAQEPAALDALIDAALKRQAAGTAAEPGRPPAEGAHFSMDYDLFGFLRAVVPLAEPDQPNPFAALADAPAAPLAYAVTFSPGEVRARLMLPLRPLVLIGRAARKGAEEKKDAAKEAPERR